MTVSEIRSLMLEKVIPESLLPQNLAVCLMDENAAPPELDAFTFLNRLHSLGIGSADFLYLLKGCGAPEETVSRIEQHPDMNLQALIVTLENSGLTPKDYTRMLYTARQLWEHTITMRIDSGELEAASAANVPETAEASDPAESSAAGETQVSEPENSVPCEQPEPKKPESSDPVRTARQKKRRNISDEEADDKLSAAPVMTARQKKRTIDDLAEELGIAAEIEDGPEEKYTARQRRSKNQEAAPEAESSQPCKVTEDSPKARRNAIIAAAAGAAVLFALDPLMDVLGFASKEASGSAVRFASDNSEIFSEIYTAYSNGRISSMDTQKMSDNEQVFGDLLINSGERLGTFSSDSTLWSAEPDGISIYSLSSSSLTCQVLPPEGAEFVKVMKIGDGLTAVYSGASECGIMGIGESGETWISGQSGTLTDIFFSEDIIRLGSVYTPWFTKSFTAEDALEYLPWTSKDSQQNALSPAEIAISGSADGCSYAVWCEYSAENGDQEKRLAALGSPVYSGAEQFAASMQREADSLIVTMNDDSMVSSTFADVTACAVGNGFIADAEKSDSGVTVYLRGSDLKPLGAFTTGGEVDSLRIRGNILYVGSEGSTVMAVDISDSSSPSALDLTAAEGTVSDGYALCGAVGKNSLTLTLYKLEDGKTAQADSFTKTLTASEAESIQFSGTNCFVVCGTDCSGAAYRYFDGVSVVDEFAELGRSRSLHTLYDDKTGYTAAAVIDGSLKLVIGDHILY